MTRLGDLHTLFSAIGQAGKPEKTDTTQSTRQRTPGYTAPYQLGLSDSSTVSSTGGSLAAALNESDVRADKVATLQSAIAAGTYNVSSSDVADSLIKHLLGNG